MADRNSIIEKIKALLAKTTENGATEAEMLSALDKASAMMDAYDISDEEKKAADFADYIAALEKAQKESAHALAEFTIACRLYLPKIREQNHRDKAHDLVDKLMPREYFNKSEAA